MSLKPWREIIVQSEFAADLTAVRSGRATPEYGDAQAFYERTFITDAHIVKWVKAGLARYSHTAKTPAWLQSRGLQLPKEGALPGSGNRLITERDIVKPSSGLFQAFTPLKLRALLYGHQRLERRPSKPEPWP